MRLEDIMPGAIGQRLAGVDPSPVRSDLCDATVAVVGATGAVGLELLALLVELGVDPSRIRAIASESSIGRVVRAAGCEFTIRGSADAHDVDVAILATPADVSRQLAPALLADGVLVSDNSSAFRNTAPLVIPELNPGVLGTEDRLIASPNCTTTIALTGMSAILKAFAPASIEIVSYQAVSGAGLDAMRALLGETRELLEERSSEPRWLSHPVAFNAFPHESAFDPASGQCEEERKFAREAGRLLSVPAGVLSATCLRVPVLRTHTLAVRLQVSESVSESLVRERLATAGGVRLVDDGPSSHEATGRCEVLVGRVRVDPALGSSGSVIRAVVAGDQLLKGAAWNALQNAALLLRRPGNATSPG